jgi:hypothetical protein
MTFIRKWRIKKMKLKEILSKTKWENIQSKLLEIYPDYQNSIKGFEKVYHELLTLTPNEHCTKYIITISRIEEKDGEIWYSVYGTKNNSNATYALDFTRWEKWLSYELSDETIMNYSNEEIVTHCLWEMTWDGFSQEQIEAKAEKIFNPEFK